MDELNEQGGVTPEETEALRELVEEFDLDPNELELQIKQKEDYLTPSVVECVMIMFMTT